MMGLVRSVALDGGPEDAYILRRIRPYRPIKNGRTRPLKMNSPARGERGRNTMSRKVTRRKFMAATAAGAAAATFKFPTPAIAQAAPFKLGLLTVKTGGAGAGRHPDGTGRAHLAEGARQQDGRPQGRVLLRRHRRQAGRHQDQGAGTDRARQGRRHPRPARRLRTAGDRRLYQAAQDADAQPRRRRRPHPAPAQSLLPAAVGDAPRRRCM